MKQKKYVAVSIRILDEELEIGYAVLTNFSFIGIEELPDEVVVHFEEKDWTDEVRDKLNQSLATNLTNASITNIEIILEKNWNEEWEKNIEAVQISDALVITPECKKNNFNCKHKILINPKMSFGTGQHSTTKLMAQMIEEFIKENGNQLKNLWVDAGTGTGVLAIIAAKLGVKKIFAFDIDEWAIENTIENVNLNLVESQIEVLLSSIDKYNFPDADCICANMYFDLVTRSFVKFYDSLKTNNGILFISGILVFDRSDLLKSAEENGFELVSEKQELEWCCFKFKIQDNSK